MDYLIDYALENTIPRELLKIEIPLEKLKQERNRRHLTFTTGFEVRVFTADVRNKQAVGNAIMGFGSPFVLLDEASLIPDIIESKVFRMIGGFSKTKHLYVKIGNPFYRNHFLKSHNDPDFHLIHIDYLQGIREGRFTDEFIQKARTKPQFDILYEVKFPGAESVDEKGWMPLLTDEDIENIMIDKILDVSLGFGFLKIGFDPPHCIVKRYRNIAEIIYDGKFENQFKATEWFVDFNKRVDIRPIGYYVDKVGLGEGYYQDMNKDLENVYGINVGQEAFDKENFVNLRAEACWKMRLAIKSKSFQLVRNENWFQLSKLKYRTKLEGRKGKIEIMSKEDMLKEGIQSPHTADALMLTFVYSDPIETITQVLTEREDEKFDRYALLPEI